LVIDISIAENHFLTATSSLRGARLFAIEHKLFCTTLKSWDGHGVAGLKDVPPVTSDRFTFGAKWNNDFAKLPDRQMKAIRASKLVVVIDDDPLVLEATEGLLRSWGCQVVAAETCGEAMTKLFEIGQRPDLIVCDYLFPQGPTGVDAIEMLRGAFEIPALIISGDSTSPRSDDGAGGYRLLHKPLNAKTFRAVLVDASVLQR
jgi:CheY-like chemotaxis protein